MVEIVAANAILAVTAEPGTDIERALGDAVDGGGGAPLWLRPGEPGDRTALLCALYAGLDLDGPRPHRRADTEDRIGDALRCQRRLIVVPAADRLRTGALATLFALWKVPDPFGWPLVLAGEAAGLDRLLGRPKLGAWPRSSTPATVLRPPAETPGTGSGSVAVSSSRAGSSRALEGCSPRAAVPKSRATASAVV